jgi:hypothetical protein
MPQRMAKPCVDEEWLSPSPTLSLTARVRVRAVDSALRSSTSKPALNLSRGFGLRAPVERRKRSLLGANVNPNGRPHGDRIVADSDDATVRDTSPVGIPTQVPNHVVGTPERRFCVDMPPLVGKAGCQPLESLGILKLIILPKFPSSRHLMQKIEHFSAENFGQVLDCRRPDRSAEMWPGWRQEVVGLQLGRGLKAGDRVARVECYLA